MSLSMNKSRLLAYFESLNAREGAKPVPVPQMVLDADENDVFAWGFQINRVTGRAGSAPLHKCGYLDADGKFHRIPYEGDLHPVLSVVPIDPDHPPTQMPTGGYDDS